MVGRPSATGRLDVLAVPIRRLEISLLAEFGEELGRITFDLRTRFGAAAQLSENHRCALSSAKLR